MVVHLTNELNKLKQLVLALSAIVEGSVEKAARAVGDRDAELAHRVIESDQQIDQMEVDVEEECLKILALHQPVAVDLRFIITVLKMNNDLERIGDLAVNIAERAIDLTQSPPVALEFDLVDMAAKAQQMLRRALDSVVNMNAELARQVCSEDDAIDAAKHAMAQKAKQKILRSPQDLDALVNLLLVSRHIERIADHATNIAEDAIYMVKGEIVRHWPGQPRP
jgi:phosphate transport system protein